ncbi:unnamed protein product [Trifolium pratense]|uniref:Uncharacterized protein n=1 Tax=Trifolium pratense TaxID=57577 RepID=A0ACB0JZT1_TRIPR|nr:unnamed protein product [Trifolium pratense]
MKGVKRDNNSVVYGSGVVAEIHTLGIQTWRNLEVDVDPALPPHFVDLTFPTCVNGALHWMSRRRSILCFNFESERFQSFPSPRSVFENNVGMDEYYEELISMEELRGLLYICDKSSFQDVAITWMKGVKRDNNSVVYGGGVVAEIHTIGIQTWRNLEVDVDPALPPYFVDLTFPTCVNGALHWISRRRLILCFNFESERFQSFHSPRSVIENNVGMDEYYEERISMGELKGLLYICDKSSFQDVAM